jgi:hypothetical protein
MTQEQRRFEVAKAMMQGMLTNPYWNEFDFEEIAEAAIRAAECLLDELANHPTAEESSLVQPNIGNKP